jgi:hypothetical protein
MKTAQESRFRTQSLAAKINDQKNYVSPSSQDKKLDGQKATKTKPLESIKATPQFLGGRCATADYATGPVM